MEKYYRPAIILAVLTVSLLSGAGSRAVEFDGRGDFRFFTDIVHLPHSGGKTLELIQVAVPAREIKYDRAGAGYRAEVEVKISIEGESGTVCSNEFARRDFRPGEKDPNPAGYLYITDSCLVAPGDYELTIKVEDLQNQKSTLLGLFFKRYHSSKIKSRFTVPSFDPESTSMSEPVFVWDFTRGGSYVPNPMKVYGLEKDTLAAFVKVRFSESFMGDRAGISMRIIDDSKDEILAFDSTSVNIDKREMIFTEKFDISRYPSGSYLFMAGIHGRREGFFSSGSFSVVWEMKNWQRPERDQLLEAGIIFGSSKYDEFLMSDSGRREEMLKDFWEKADPSPETSVNEAYSKFIERVEYADRFYSGFQRGAVTPRGEIYIKYGKPDQLVQSTIPSNRREYSEVLAKLASQYEIVTYNVHGSRPDELVRSGDPYAMRGRPFTSMGMDAGAYELWIYTGNGDPLFRRDDYMTLKSGLRFLFVDKRGTGEYRLVGSSEDAEYILDES